MTTPAGPGPSLAALPPLATEDHVCAECDIAFADVPVERALVVVAGIPAAAAAAVAEVPDAARGLRPAPGVWSVAAYACHLRDVYATYTIRLFRTRTERRPQLEPMLADLRAVRFGYDRCDVAAVLAQLAAHVEGFGQEAADVGAKEWDRVAVRRPDERRTARWLVRQAMHEGVHHVRDIGRVGQQVRGGV